MTGAAAVMLLLAGCTRSVGAKDLCEAIDAYEAGDEKAAFLDCGTGGEVLHDCDPDVTGKSVSHEALMALLDDCPDSDRVANKLLDYECPEDDSRVLWVYGGSCELPW